MINHLGFITLQRKILEWEWYKDINTKSLFIHLLLKANHSPAKYQGIDIARGQVLTGRKALSNDLGISEQSIRTSINRLKSTNEITIKSTNKNSIITIINYDLYQSKKEPNQQPNQQLTNDQPATNQQVTTNNNDNNLNNAEQEETNIPENDFIFENQDSKEVLQLSKEIGSFFQISEISNPNQFMKIGNFVRCLEGKGKLDHLEKQFKGYKAVKNDGKFIHAIENYMGSTDKSYEDGQWNSKLWYKNGSENQLVVSSPKRLNRNPS